MSVNDEYRLIIIGVKSYPQSGDRDGRSDDHTIHSNDRGRMNDGIKFSD